MKCSLSYSVIVENKMGITYLICLSNKNKLLSLLIRVRIKTYFPLKKAFYYRQIFTESGPWGTAVMGYRKTGCVIRKQFIIWKDKLDKEMDLVLKFVTSAQE